MQFKSFAAAAVAVVTALSFSAVVSAQTPTATPAPKMAGKSKMAGGKMAGKSKMAGGKMAGKSKMAPKSKMSTKTAPKSKMSGGKMDKMAPKTKM